MTKKKKKLRKDYLPGKNFSSCTVGKGLQNPVQCYSQGRGDAKSVVTNSTFSLGAGIFIHALIQQTHTEFLLWTKPKGLKVGSALSFPILVGRQSNIQTIAKLSAWSREL